MGYRSDIHFAVAFQNEADLKEVVAVYTIDPLVQKHNLLQEWEVKQDNILYYEATSIKWYDTYEDVQGIEYMMRLVETFHEERDMPIAYRFIRIGEDDNDTATFEEHGGDDGTLMGMLWDRMHFVRTVEVTL